MTPPITKRRLVILTEGRFDVFGAKTAVSVIRYCREEVVAILDRFNAGKEADSIIGVGKGIPIVAGIEETFRLKPTALLIGIAPPGGMLPAEWRVHITNAIKNKLSVISGLHCHVSEDIEFSRLAQEFGVSYEEIMGWFCQGFGFGEIDLAYSLSLEYGVPVTDIFAMREAGEGWGNIKKYLEPNSVDLTITSPPYWDILNRKGTADRKEIQNYGNSKQDFGNIADYEDFLLSLQNVFKEVYDVTRLGRYCIVVVMDIRKGPKLYQLHSDLTRKMEETGFTLNDIIIWDRQKEYNNMRPLGYPAVFRVNKAHEFILVMQKVG